MKFLSYHTVPKNPETVFPENRKLFSALETSQKNYLPLRKINNFSKKYLVKKLHNSKKRKKRPFRLIKRFLQTDNFKKIRVTFSKIQKLSENVA